MLWERKNLVLWKFTRLSNYSFIRWGMDQKSFIKSMAVEKDLENEWDFKKPTTG